MIAINKYFINIDDNLLTMFNHIESHEDYKNKKNKTTNFAILSLYKELMQMSKWNIEDTLSEADGEHISKEEVCTDCPKNIEVCEFWKNCSRSFILGKRRRKELEKYD